MLLSKGEHLAIRREIPEDVYSKFGGSSGTADSYLLTAVLKELRELRQQVDRLTGDNNG